MKLDGLDHPKTLDLASRLDVSLPQAIGHLELLWAFVAQKTPRGNIGKWADGSIARACHWTGDASAFVTALSEAGFLDAHKEHRFIVHDWPEHAPRWVVSKLARAKESFCIPDSTGDCSADCSPDSTSHSKPSLVKSSQDKGSQDKKSECADAPAGKPAKVSVTANDLVNDYGISQQHAAEWLAVRKAKRLTLTKTAMDNMINEASKAGLTLNDAVQMCIKKSWGGFEARFLNGNHGNGQAAETPRQRAMRMAADMGIQYEPQ